MTVGKSVGKSRPLDRRPPHRRTSDASRAPGATMVRKGSSVRVPQMGSRALSNRQEKRNSLRGAILGLEQRGRNSRPRTVHFVTPRAPVGEANRPAVWSSPWVPPAAHSFSASARATSCVPPAGGPGESWGPAAVAPLAVGRDRSLGITACTSRPAGRSPATGASMRRALNREAPGDRPAFRRQTKIKPANEV